MKEQFREKRFKSKSVVLLKRAQAIIAEYEAQSIIMTLRQLYYQLVSRAYLDNTPREYGKLSRLLTDARYCGLVDWDAIEDRVRVPQRPSQFEDISDLVECAKASYRLDRWRGQKYYIELFTEKDALSSILHPITRKWHVYFNVNRGYSSATAMYNTAKRYIREINNEKHLVLLYLGDHDPSGLDMIRDIGSRLEEFEVDNLQLVHIALTSQQIKKYNPPPNPAKISDPRATEYIAIHGKKSWEVDALKPEVLIKLVENSISRFVDEKLMSRIVKREKKEMRRLEEFAEKL